MRTLGGLSFSFFSLLHGLNSLYDPNTGHSSNFLLQEQGDLIDTDSEKECVKDQRSDAPGEKIFDQERIWK